MDTRKLRHFLAICDHGTGRKAADAIHLSQSALSRSIQTLEDEVGARLFDRIDQNLHITPFGCALRDRARVVLFQVNEIRRELELLRDGDAGQIGLGLTPTPAALILNECMARLASDHSGVKVNITFGRTGELLDGLRAERFDVVIVDLNAIGDPKGLDLEVLPSLPGGFHCRREHPLAGAGPVSIDHLRRFPIACSPLSEVMAMELVATLGEGAHPDRLITMRCDDYSAMRKLMLASDTILMSVTAFLRDDLESGVVRSLSVSPHSTMLGRYSIARLAGRTLSPALDVVYDSARRQFRVDSNA